MISGTSSSQSWCVHETLCLMLYYTKIEFILLAITKGSYELHEGGNPSKSVLMLDEKLINSF